MPVHRPAVFSRPGKNMTPTFHGDSLSRDGFFVSRGSGAIMDAWDELLAEIERQQPELDRWLAEWAADGEVALAEFLAEMERQQPELDAAIAKMLAEMDMPAVPSCASP